MLIETDVGERSPQPTPNFPLPVSFFAAARNCAHVHGLSTVGTLTPAAFSTSTFAKTLYVCSNVGTAVILRPNVTASQTRFEMLAFRLAGISVRRSAM